MLAVVVKEGKRLAEEVDTITARRVVQTPLRPRRVAADDPGVPSPARSV